jgi:hypothetical protein
MHNFRKLQVLILLIVLAPVLSGCGGNASRADDAAPVPEVVVEATATSVPVEPSSEPEIAGTTPAAETEASEAGTEAGSSDETSPPAEPQPEAGTGPAVITLNVSGGIVGFCDTLTVNQTGEYTFQSCAGEEITGTLEGPDLEAVQDWSTNLAGFSLNFEDNPGGPDNLVTEFQFEGQGEEEADETLKQVMVDWANGLLIRTRPQAVEAPPTPALPEIGPDGLCPEVSRPAMLIGNFDNPSGLILIDPASQVSCDILLLQPPFGRVLTAAGDIYYPVFDPEAETITVWRLSAADGSQVPLEFTTVSMEQFGPFSFVLSDDGTKIAWGRAEVNPESDPPIYRNDLWVANIDGSDQVTLLEQVENNESRYVELVRFSQDNSTLFYALQPDGIGGMIFNFSGRFDNLYRVSAAGGESELLYDCSTSENLLCIGDISPDGSTLAYTQPAGGAVQVMSSAGSLINTITPPATDYIGPAIFGPTGTLAIISATLAQPEQEDELPRPTPGYISLVEPPYTGQPQTLLSNDGVATIWEWLDDRRLSYGNMDETGSIGTSILTIEGQSTELSPNFPLAVLR